MFFNKKGFTLIELLVVIAIIGILSSVVLGNLNTARSKGGDAAVKSNLVNMRAQAALIYDNGNNYGSGQVAGICPTTAGNSYFATTTIINQINAATKAGGGLNSCATDVTTSAQAWAVTANLKSNTSQFWCVDSNGSSKLSTVASPANTQTYADSVVANGKCN